MPGPSKGSWKDSMLRLQGETEEDMGAAPGPVHWMKNCSPEKRAEFEAKIQADEDRWEEVLVNRRREVIQTILEAQLLFALVEWIIIQASWGRLGWGLLEGTIVGALWAWKKPGPLSSALMAMPVFFLIPVLVSPFWSLAYTFQGIPAAVTVGAVSVVLGMRRDP